MKNTLKAILAIFFVLFIASCKEEKKPISTLPSPMEEIDTTNIKKSLLREVRNFIDEHPKTDAFILYNIEKYKVKKGYDNTCIGCRIYFNEVYCIREAYYWHFGDGEFIVRRNYPHRYIDINGKIIYVPSEDDSFYDQKKLKSIVDSTVVKEERPIDKRYFIIYDLKDSCEKISYPFFSDSIYEYEPNSITPIFTKDEQTTHIHFVNIKASPEHNSK